MAKPRHTKRIELSHAKPGVARKYREDAERFALRLVNDQKRADLALQRELREWV
ncbi:hypothetical protein [Vreelandella aquamarina]|uniref:hypothetical protein n=1 Tax=Vreelandella aquamarina TaxID=77097 RepID=UPI001D185765|nr:hypothetical protein [Halomonas meridiana]MCC4288481.1 hypothetical protein [Halomonas meridiana]